MAEKEGFFKRLKNGLEKTRDSFVSGVDALFHGASQLDDDFYEELEEILAQIAGVGKVRVMLTEVAGSETIYQTDEDRNQSSDSESLRSETVLVSDSDRTEKGLVRTIVPPVYLGAIIVCQGGDSPVVRLSIVQAVSNVTGIGTDRITVVKMK